MSNMMLIHDEVHFAGVRRYLEAKHQDRFPSFFFGGQLTVFQNP
jgi:hypothetical protein